MTVEFLPDALRKLVEPFIPVAKAKPNSRSPRLADRACLTGIVFVLRSGIPWEMLPQEMGCGSGAPRKYNKLKKLAERVGFEPRLSNEINKLGGANGTANLHNSTKTTNSISYWTFGR
jgi:transposase